MKDLDFISHVTRQCPNCLGFIPDSAIQAVHLARGLWLPITSRRGRRVGFMLHGPLRAGYPLRIYQCAVLPDHRFKEAATRAVAELRRRARECGAPEIQLKCRENLEANYFWDAMGAHLIGIHPGGIRYRSPVNEYRIDVDPAQTPKFYLVNRSGAAAQRSTRPVRCP